MYNRSFKLVAFILVLFCSCRNNSIDEGKSKFILIDNSKIKDTADISNIIDSISIVKLNEDINVPLSDPFQLYSISSSKYVILNNLSGNRRVLSFDKSGNYINTVIKNGFDNNDFINITDSYGDKNGLLVYDFVDYKINIYDTSLVLVNTIKGDKPLHYSHLARMPGSKKIVGYANFNMGNPKNFLVNVLDEKLNISDEFFSFPSKFRKLLILTYNRSFYEYRDSLRFFMHFDPSIYTVTKSGIRKSYEVKYKEGSVSNKELFSIIEDSIKYFSESGYVQKDKVKQLLEGRTFPRGGYLENENFIHITSQMCRGDNITYFISIISKKNLSSVFSGKCLMDKKYGILLPHINEYDRFSGDFLSLVTGLELKSCLLKNSALMPKDSIDITGFYIIKTKFNDK